ncbi:MAG: FtsX-like permease family protein, partial [Acidimicrobiales bacterium]
MFRVALKELLARKRRLVTTGIAITLGIAFLTGTQLLSGVLNDSIESLVTSVYDRYDAIVRSPQVQETGFGQPIRGPIASSVVTEVEAVPGVAAANGVIEAQSAQLMGKDGKTLGSGFGPPTIVSNAVEDSLLQVGTYTEGDRPSADNEIALDFATADKNGFTLGAEISVATQDGVEKFDLVGLNGLGDEGDRTSGSVVMTFTTPTAQRLARLTDQFSYIAVAGEPGVSQDTLAERIAVAVPAQQTLTGAEYIRETQDQIAQFVDILSTFVSVFGYIALIVAAFIIYNTFSIIVAQRSREIALLRAIGAKRRQVLSSTLVEATAIGLVASLIGLAVGLL